VGEELKVRGHKLMNNKITMNSSRELRRQVIETPLKNLEGCP
jgi:hypothetical protein